MALLANGCGTTTRSATDTAPVVVRIGVTQPAGSGSPTATALDVARLLRYASLLVTARDGTIQPGLADRWQMSADGRTLHLSLKAGLAFHDGSPLDAPAAAAALGGALRDAPVLPGLRAVTAVRAVSPTEVVVEQREPSSLLLEAISMREVLGGADGESTAGPYRLVSGQKGRVLLEAFDGYYRGRPAIDRVEIVTHPSARAGWVALMRDDIDVLYDVPPDALEFVEASTDIQVFSFLRPYAYLLGFNLAHPALRDARVRRALGLAVDRRAVVEQVFGGRALPATSGVWLRHWAFDNSLPPPRHAPEDARALLDAGGLPRPRASVALPSHVVPMRLHLSCLVPAGYTVFERLAIMLQRQLLDVGVDLEPEVLPVRELAARLAAGRFDTFLFEQAAGPQLSWTYWFWHSPADPEAFLRSNYHAADAALDHLRGALERDGFRSAVRDVQQVLSDDPPAIFLAWSERSRAVRRRFVVASDGGRDVLLSLPQWRLAAGSRGR